MLRHTAFLALILITLTGAKAVRAEDQPDDKKEAKKPVVQIAVLLDTSGSMRGLIDQAKSQLWKIVNEFTNYKRGGQRPDVYVSLYHYGTPSLGAYNGFVKQLLPLGLDLDRVSDELFRLQIDGGNEYCGAVIDHAVKHLPWSKNDSDLKLIFIAGNEPFNQGQVAYQAAVEEAKRKGIIVNTIFCGNEGEGINTHWKAGADLGGGAYAFIDGNKQAVHIEAPQDKLLITLSGDLNKTYVPFMEGGAACAVNQTLQDNNAAGLITVSAAVDRAATKASRLYVCSWDLVDASKDEKFDWKTVKAELLPEELRKLTADELKTHIKKLGSQRATIQDQIKELKAAREQFVDAKRKEIVKNESGKTLEDAIITAIRKQAEAKSFVVDGK